MKPVLLVVLTGGIGLAVGWTVASSHQRAVSHVFGPTTGIIDAATSLDEEPRPVMTMLDGTVHSFGRMERGANGACSFRIRNDGNAVLELNVLKASCKCTRAEVLQPKLAPGETTTLELEWQAVLPSIDPEFREKAPVLSNDPDHPRTLFAIAGELFFAVEAKPSRVSLGNIRSNVEQRGEVEIICHTQDEFEVTDIVLQDESLAEFVSFEVLPLGAKQIASYDAQSGVKVRATLKAGLPPGRFNCQATLKTNVVGSDVPLSIEAHVVSDISIIGEGFSLATNILEMGPVASAEGGEVKLLMLVKGEFHDKTAFTVASVDPASSLEVEIGEGRPLATGAITQFPLYIRVPQGAPLVNRRGTEQAKAGAILIETTHPRIKRMQIWVRFAVE